MRRYLVLGITVAMCAALVVPRVMGQEARPTRFTSTVTPGAPMPKVDRAKSTDWDDHNGDLTNSRYSPADLINTTNVGKLALKWTYEMPKAESIAEQTPLVVEGLMYFNAGSKLYALDAETGKVVWTSQLSPTFGGGKRGPSYGDGVVYAMGPGEIYATDAKTGKPLESFGNKGVLRIIDKALEFKYPGKLPAGADPRQYGYSLGATPKFHKGMLYAGTSDSDSLIAGGLLIAADAKTGAIKWVFNTVPQGPADDGWDLTKGTWPATAARQGGGIWTQPAIDPALGMIYFNSANPAPDYDGSARLGTNLFTNSIVALDLATGKYRWHFQTIHHDIWDKDAVAGPTLFDVTQNGKTVKGIGSSGKVCYVYLLNRETGAPINPIVETPVPTITDVPGEQPWPTQPIPYTSRNIPQQPFCATYPRIDDPALAAKARPLFHPYLSKEMVITSPGQDGGSDYGGPAFSPRTGYFYVSGKNDAVANRVQPVGGTLKPSSRSIGHFDNIAETGKTGMAWNQAITAYEPVSGRQVWYTEFPGWTNASHVVTAGDVIFHGSGGVGDVFAFDARTGKQLFKYPGHFGDPTVQRSGIMASPMTYRVNGRQYVAIVARATVLVFGLP